MFFIMLDIRKNLLNIISIERLRSFDYKKQNVRNEAINVINAFYDKFKIIANL